MTAVIPAASSTAELPCMENEAIVTRVRADHDALRRALVVIGALSRRASEKDPAAAAPLRKHGLELHARLCRHLDLEERELLPAVEREGEWGAEVARHVRREHDEQRLLLRLIFERLSDASRPDELVARDLASLALALRTDMSVEDRELLAPLSQRRSGEGA